MGSRLIALAHKIDNQKVRLLMFSACSLQMFAKSNIYIYAVYLYAYWCFAMLSMCFLFYLQCICILFLGRHCYLYIYITGSSRFVKFASFYQKIYQKAEILQIWKIQVYIYKNTNPTRTRAPHAWPFKKSCIYIFSRPSPFVLIARSGAATVTCILPCSLVEFSIPVDGRLGVD